MITTLVAGFPRTRGDEPNLTHENEEEKVFSPHTRG